jgi:quinol monooxygenase YgiN
MAFVRIGQFTARPEHVNDLRTTYERDAIPRIRAASGNISAVLLQQHQATDEFLAITIWRTRADAEAYDASGQAAAMVATIRHAFAAPPVLTTYDAFGIPE